MKLQKKEKETCESCGKKTQERGCISVNVTNPWNRYQGSNRAFVMISKTKLCKKCFASFNKEFKKLILKY